MCFSLPAQINMLRRELKFANDTRTATQMGFTITQDGTLERALQSRSSSRGGGGGSRARSQGSRRRGSGASRGGMSQHGATGAGAGSVGGGGGAGAAGDDAFTPEDAREIDMQHQQIQQLREHLSRLRMAAGLDPTNNPAAVGGPPGRDLSSRERLPPMAGVAAEQESKVAGPETQAQ